MEQPYGKERPEDPRPGPRIASLPDESFLINLKPGIEPIIRDKVFCHHDDAVLRDNDRKEFAAWGRFDTKVSRMPGPQALFNEVLLKANFLKTFRSLLPSLRLSGSETILEMGAGCGWASTVLKRSFPNTYVVASDLVPESIKHAHLWEQWLDTPVDEKWSFHCRAIPFAEDQFDRIFTFAAFHHFGEAGNFRDSLAEMVRVLKPGGKIHLLYEPYAPRYLYPLSLYRANRIREADGVEEDLLLLPKMRRWVRELSCRLQVGWFPCSAFRGSVGATLYYALLSKLGPLVRLFPCSVNLTIEK